MTWVCISQVIKSLCREQDTPSLLSVVETLSQERPLMEMIGNRLNRNAAALLHLDLDFSYDQGVPDVH